MLLSVVVKEEVLLFKTYANAIQIENMCLNSPHQKCMPTTTLLRCIIVTIIDLTPNYEKRSILKLCKY